ncbi:hypothetical protein Hanom_Chr01g00039541 [Helianthus anomalus]
MFENGIVGIGGTLVGNAFSYSKVLKHIFHCVALIPIGHDPGLARCDTHSIIGSQHLQWCGKNTKHSIMEVPRPP